MKAWTLLKSHRSYLRWYADTIQSRPFDYEDGEHAANMREWRERADAYGPESYPCIAFASVADWGMEECDPHFVYPADAQPLLDSVAP